jgi:hypothetical protein
VTKWHVEAARRCRFFHCVCICRCRRTLGPVVSAVHDIDPAVGVAANVVNVLNSPSPVPGLPHASAPCHREYLWGGSCVAVRTISPSGKGVCVSSGETARRCMEPACRVPEPAGLPSSDSGRNGSPSSVRNILVVGSHMMPCAAVLPSVSGAAKLLLAIGDHRVLAAIEHM